jgi:hypothetical protein
MANCAASMSQLSDMALGAAIPLGFNAAGVEHWYDSETFEPRLTITFGEQKAMRRPRLRTPCDWALSYAEDVACTREQRTIEVPFDTVYKASYDVEQLITTKLLELVSV